MLVSRVGVESKGKGLQSDRVSNSGDLLHSVARLNHSEFCAMLQIVKSSMKINLK